MDEINVMYAAQCSFNNIFIEYSINMYKIIKSRHFIVLWIFVTFYDIATITIIF